jgi:flavodoxin
MKKALVIYHSKTGITRRFAENISAYCKDKGINSTVISISNFNASLLADVDYLFLGCWTSGLMIALQHPEKIWVNFASSLPEIKNSKVILFTTYKIATGSMFKKMKKYINCNAAGNLTELKSRNGYLTEKNKIMLDEVLEIKH